MHIAPYLCTFGFLAVFHAVRVMRLRAQYKVLTGDSGHEDLARMIRVFGNFSEFVPLGLILLMACEFVQSPPWFLHFSGATLLLGRSLHAISLGKTGGPFWPKMVGMALTFTSLIVSSLGVLFFSVYVS